MSRYSLSVPPFGLPRAKVAQVPAMRVRPMPAGPMLVARLHVDLMRVCGMYCCPV